MKILIDTETVHTKLNAQSSTKQSICHVQKLAFMGNQRTLRLKGNNAN